MARLELLAEGDYAAVWKIFHDAFEHKYIQEFQDVWNARNIQLSFGIFDDQRILLGFLLTKQIQDKHQQIEFLGVSPKVQKGGVGTRLLRSLLDMCKPRDQLVTLVPVNDEAIIGWYKKHGFQPYGPPRISPYTGEIEQTMAVLFSHVGLNKEKSFS
jgi:ribosomal protein S18 acetylase RimI-like enzyme